jgi:hypothetical protein
MIAAFGLDEQLRDPVEVHCYYTTGFLITLRRAHSDVFSARPSPASMTELAVPADTRT